MHYALSETVHYRIGQDSQDSHPFKTVYNSIASAKICKILGRFSLIDTIGDSTTESRLNCKINLKKSGISTESRGLPRGGTALARTQLQKKISGILADCIARSAEISLDAKNFSYIVESVENIEFRLSKPHIDVSSWLKQSHISL